MNCVEYYMVLKLKCCMMYCFFNFVKWLIIIFIVKKSLLGKLNTQIAMIRWAHAGSRWKCGRRYTNVGPTFNRFNNVNYLSHTIYIKR